MTQRRKPSKRKKNRGIHEALVDGLVERLEEKGYYSIIKNLEYHSRGFSGEFDVLALRGDYAHYYEVKSTYTPTSLRTARTQFERANKAFPERKWKFIYYTPTRIQREMLTYG